MTDAFSSIITSEVEIYINAIPTLLVRLATYLQLWSQPQEALSTSAASSSFLPPQQKFRKHFLNLLLPLLTRKDFIDALRTFFSSTLDLSILDPEAAYHAEAFTSRAIQAIHYLTLLERFEPLLLGVVYAAIENRITSTAAGEFESESVLSGLGEWLTTDIGKWLISFYSLAFNELSEDQARSRAAKVLKPIVQRFEWHIYSILFKLRTSELFDMVVDYPASLPGIRDLTTCLIKTDQRQFLIRSLNRQIKARLLHPGADTRDILTQYISLIRALRIVDPPGVLLARCANAMRAYLRAREDTIRCIVQGMVDEEGDLLTELQGGTNGSRSDPGATNTRELREKEEDDLENYNDDNYTWTPAPVDAPADYSRNKAADIVQLLVSIYDTKELFIKELQHLLAERLLAIKSNGFERELRNIEILKIRFGEAALSGLEVMLKDCADSKRIDNALHSAANQHVNIPSFGDVLHTTIVSHLFWPSFQRHSLKLPGQLGRMTDAYEKAFRQMKPEKRLQWIPNLGSVSLEITLKDRSLSLDVTPTQAAVLELFSEKCECNRLFCRLL